MKYRKMRLRRRARLEGQRELREFLHGWNQKLDDDPFQDGDREDPALLHIWDSDDEVGNPFWYSHYPLVRYPTHKKYRGKYGILKYEPPPFGNFHHRAAAAKSLGFDLGTWHTYRWYRTQEARDEAYLNLIVQCPVAFFEGKAYRKVERRTKG